MPAVVPIAAMDFWSAQWRIWGGMAVVDLVLRLAIYQNLLAAAVLTILMFPVSLGLAAGMRAVYRRHRPEDLPPGRATVVVLLTSTLAAVLLVLAAASIRLAVGWRVSDWDLFEIWLLFGTFHLAVMLGWSLGYVWLATARARQQHDALARQAQALAVRHELDKLRVQLEPHFLFNALNGVGTEILDHPQQALAMVRDLSDFVRHALRTLERPVVSVAEELAALQAYLAIQQARFGDDLTIVQDIDPAALDREIASFVLQPLIENAFEHGSREPDLRLEFSVRAVGADLDIRIWNRGAMRPCTDPGHQGLGLANLRRRLQWHYADRHVLRLEAFDRHGQDLAPWVCATLYLTGVPCSDS